MESAQMTEQSNRVDAGVDNTHLEQGEVVFGCKPLWEDGGREGIERDGLRCRFSKGFKQVDVPVLPGEGWDELMCRCNAEFTATGTKVSILLRNGDELSCEAMPEADKVKGVVAAGQIYRQLSLLDRYLFVWIFVVMGLALLIGYYVGGIKKRLSVVEISSLSLPIAIGLWVMMYPVLCKRLPDLPDYRTGVILVGIARCIAMVLIWNELAKGDSQLCAVIVAVNSILQIALFTPVSLFYLQVVSRGKGIDVSAWTVAKSVLLFLGVPLGAGVLTRFTLRRGVGPKWYDTKFIPFIGPFALLGLLYTIFVMFAIQAHEIVNNIGEVARVVVPMILYFAITFTSSVLVTRHLKLPYPEIVTQSFTAASNNFELAIAVAVGAFGIDSHEALAATIGPLIEVPALLLLVYVTLFFRKWLSRA
ncbi:hypothetical protein R1sor_001618 [Riccia sorocarpa]|uniref:Arsenite transporter n=1 Tax=Riccia sorocarpa TaxID=122646 RepID=A0ABD3GYE9_9MARC